MKKENYSFLLANDQKWNITSSDAAKPWLDKFSTVFGLKPGVESKNHSQIKFYSMGEFNSQGWQEYSPTKIIKIWEHPEKPDVVFEIEDKNEHVLQMISLMWATYPIFKSAKMIGGLPMHSALIEKNGKGFLLSAPGGTGKSTCCQRVPAPWQALSDDEVLVLPVKDGFSVHPFPTWSVLFMEKGIKSWEVEKHVPLSAIFFIEQSPADSFTSIGQGEASILIGQASTQTCRRMWRNIDPKEEARYKTMIFDNACRIAKKVPAFKLKVSLTGRFWEEIERALENVSQN